MSCTTESIPGLTGHSAVVTGGSAGLGRETARALAARNARVVIAARDQDKAARAVEGIGRTVAVPSLEVVELDLGCLDSVRAAAQQILAQYDCMAIPVNNAGVVAVPEGRTADGFEMQFGINHLGHWALTALLMSAVLAAAAPRRAACWPTPVCPTPTCRCAPSQRAAAASPPRCGSSSPPRPA